MKAQKHCDKFMELKSVTARLTEYNLFFQCKKCGKVVMVTIPEFINNKLNVDLLERRKQNE